MNKIKSIILILTVLLTVSSCKDWLYVEPENGIIVEEFWQSKEDVHSAMMGIYASMLGNTQGGSYSIPECMFYWGELRAEMISPYRSSFDNFTYIRNGDILPTNRVVYWDAFYTTINYCNVLLAKAPEVLNIDDSFTESALNAYKGEALAVRALMYFYLVRAFDEVPLVLEATLSDAQTFRKAKSTRTEIFNQIFADLNQAEQWISEDYGINALNKGRMTKYAVNAIQADAYLWTEQYQQSIEACDKVIDSGKYGLVPRDDFWFEDLYVKGNSSEGIFELQFADDKLNPFFNLFETVGQLKANSDMMEVYFPVDIYASPDSADIRGDGCSYKSSRNFSLWKYIGRNKYEAKEREEATNNFMVYRYADVLLLKAEALAQVDRGSESLALIKEIRKRAHATRESDEGNPTDKNALVNYILNERAREFAFEGKRWFDILRNARRDNYARMDLIRTMVSVSAPAERMLNILTKYGDTLSHYFPIAQKEIDAGYPILEQNKFYQDQ
ncbi:RagB/SusD family nutrient uptake outer membrane protein [Saccharicrinis sp. FJH62]|uniref:RagB/SusD family nutrient uptake outer membrane protein n=1 Tax=Saccharicrinis sp. FJH62 TaxID=3344657 RepID=UPI0035D43B26